MTTTVQTAISGPYTLSGGTTVPVTFQSTADDEIAVLLDDVEVDSGDYAFDRDEDGTGTVTFSSATTGTVYVISAPSFAQEADFQAFGPWSPHYINIHLDRAARRDIWLREQLQRTIKVAVGETAPVLPAHPDAAGLALVTTEGGLEWDALEFNVTTAAGASVDTRVLLRGIVGPVSGQTAYLTEAGRAGWFRFSTANLSAAVTADPREGIYVAPSAAPTGASGAWVRVLESDVVYSSWYGLAGGGVVDDQPAHQAALNCPFGSVVEAPAGTFGLGTQLIIPDGKWFRGQGVGETIFTPLATYSPRSAGFNQGITCSNTATNVRCSDMTWDGNKVGIGLGTGMRICGFVPSGTNFHFARLSVIDCSGYAVWTFGKVGGTPCSGVVEDVWSWNADIHFESSISDGVKWSRCHARMGDGDFSNSNVFHPYDRSTNIEYRDCSGIGTFSSPMHSIADGFDIRIKLINCELETDYPDASALQPTGTFATHLEIIGGRFVSEEGSGASVVADVTLKAIAATFSGYQIGVGVAADAVAEFTSCDIYAETPSGSGLSTWALYNDGDNTTVSGISSLVAAGPVGMIAATGGALSATIGPNVTLVPAPAGSAIVRQQAFGQIAPTADGTAGADNIYLIDVYSPSNPGDSDKCHIAISLHDTAETDSVLGSPSFTYKWSNLTGVAANCFRVRIRTPASLTGINVAYHFVEWA